MKKNWMAALAAALMLLVLCSCGGQQSGGQQGGSQPGASTPAAAEKEVDLSALYGELAKAHGDDWAGLVDIEGEMLDAFYPGMSELNCKQMVAKQPMMSAVVNEIFFVQCETEADADKAAEIFQARINYQVGDETNPGGAWYPESIEAWEKAEVVRHGAYVALVASSEFQSEIVEAFNKSFQ